MQAIGVSLDLPFNESAGELIVSLSLPILQRTKRNCLPVHGRASLLGGPPDEGRSRPYSGWDF